MHAETLGHGKVVSKLGILHAVQHLLQTTSSRNITQEHFLLARVVQVPLLNTTCMCVQGFGYVEFGSNSALQKAVELEDPELHGRRMTIMVSKPPSAGPAGTPHRPVFLVLKKFQCATCISGPVV